MGTKIKLSASVDNIQQPAIVAQIIANCGSYNCEREHG